MSAVTDQRGDVLGRVPVVGIGAAVVFIDAPLREERARALGELASSH
jgi:hypothetical protein